MEKQIKLRYLVEKLLYDDLTPYLTGIRDCLNFIENVEYIDDDFLEFVEEQVEERIKELDKNNLTDEIPF